ncbi:hypothetical protein Tsubulata_040234 [Turnera subulata]|uniref:Uncharacterized protein n=1 Tax=Turnera subulata TaxID=218843 RepID=A0A9Q0JG65_9ROSI|nr:hypothetical protein Tsubulata_040234 [Turnera subulata]
MLRQSPSRRSKGLKTKHVLQICLLLALGVWLLNQLKRSYSSKANVHEEINGKVSSENLLSEHQVIKFGRKELIPRVEESSGVEVGDRADQSGEDVKQPDQDMEDEGRGGGDDEIDGHDQERAEEEESEEVEDLIDVEDREREEGSEEQENEDKGGGHLEDGKSVDHNILSQNEGRRSVQEAREEHYRGDDASSAVVQNSQKHLGVEFETGGLRKVKEKEVTDEEDAGLVRWK